MKIVYFISAYKLPEQLVRLVNKLNTNTTLFIIHVDKKSDDETYRRMFDPLNPLPNIIFIKKRELCYWGQFGHLKATLACIREIYAKKFQYDYLIFLTGQDYLRWSRFFDKKVT